MPRLNRLHSLMSNIRQNSVHGGITELTLPILLLPLCNSARDFNVVLVRSLLVIDLCVIQYFGATVRT